MSSCSSPVQGLHPHQRPRFPRQCQTTTASPCPANATSANSRSTARVAIARRSRATTTHDAGQVLHPPLRAFSTILRPLCQPRLPTMHDRIRPYRETTPGEATADASSVETATATATKSRNLGSAHSVTPHTLVPAVRQSRCPSASPHINPHSASPISPKNEVRRRAGTRPPTCSHRDKNPRIATVEARERIRMQTAIARSRCRISPVHSAWTARERPRARSHLPISRSRSRGVGHHCRAFHQKRVCREGSRQTWVD